MDRQQVNDVLHRLHAAQQAFYAGTGGSDVLRNVLTEDIRWHVPGANLIAGRYVGIDAVLDYFERRRGLAAATLRLHEGDLLTGESDTAAVLRSGTATIGGVEHTWSTVGLYRFRNNRVSSCHLLPLDPAEFDRIWS